MSVHVMVLCCFQFLSNDCFLFSRGFSTLDIGLEKAPAWFERQNSSLRLGSFPEGHLNFMGWNLDFSVFIRNIFFVKNILLPGWTNICVERNHIDITRFIARFPVKWVITQSFSYNLFFYGASARWLCSSGTKHSTSTPETRKILLSSSSSQNHRRESIIYYILNLLIKSEDHWSTTDNH